MFLRYYTGEILISSSAHFSSLDEFLISATPTVNEQVELEPGTTYPLKGREIEATILFADMSGYSARTLDLNPVEILLFVNHFFSSVTTVALRATHGIVAEYIGDEMMIVFSSEFGSEDPFEEAVQVVRQMGERDYYGFVPHVGIASGPVIVGYVGTASMNKCSVAGAPVVLASRCAGIRPDMPEETEYGLPSYFSSITFPAAEWGSRAFDTRFPAKKYQDDAGRIVTEHPTTWELLQTRAVEPKNMPELEIREVVDRAFHVPSTSPEDSAKHLLEELRAANRYRPEADA